MSITTAYIDGQNAAAKVLDDVLKGVAHPDALLAAFNDYLDRLATDEPPFEEGVSFVKGYFRAIQKTVEAKTCLPH